ncbi:MAG: hypothetical protein FJW30_19800 [Acidobacteria bacterium]|nr:hypothetical protein [Acidobacteriota bacterium]
MGLVLIVAFAFNQLKDNRRAALLASAFLLYQVGYLWFYKHPQYVERAQPTVKLLQTVRDHNGPIFLECFPYGHEVVQRALEIETEGRVWLAKMNEEHPHGLLFDGCTSD